MLMEDVPVLREVHSSIRERQRIHTILKPYRGLVL